MALNMNDHVTFELTEQGKHVLLNYRIANSIYLEKITGKKHPYETPKDEETLILWELFEIFGGEIGVGSDVFIRNLRKAKK